MKKSDKLHDENLDELKSHHYKNDKIDWIEYFDVSKCELVSKCKACSFKELQSWPECQKTGYRLIQKCKEVSLGSVKSDEEFGKSNQVCFVKTDILQSNMETEYGEAYKIPEGLLAD